MYIFTSGASGGGRDKLRPLLCRPMARGEHRIVRFRRRCRGGQIWGVPKVDFDMYEIDRLKLGHGFALGRMK